MKQYLKLFIYYKNIENPIIEFIPLKPGKMSQDDLEDVVNSLLEKKPHAKLFVNEAKLFVNERAFVAAIDEIRHLRVSVVSESVAYRQMQY